MSASKACTIRCLPDGLYLAAPFNREFVRELKSSIYYKDREWDEDNKTWIINYAHQNTVEAIAKKHFNEAFRVVGDTTVNLHTGFTLTARRLF